jgi:hypothetical protein
MNDTRAPFTLSASALDPDTDDWSLSLTAQDLQPGSLTAPLLAAAFPLLAGDGSGAPVRIAAPLDVRLDLAGDSIEDALSGRLTGMTGGADLSLGDGQVQGGLLGRVQEALGGLGASGIALPEGLSPGGLDLSFHGFRGSIAIADARVTVREAALVGRDGQTRPLPIEGWASLDGTLHYRIPWTALIHGKHTALLEGRALSIEGHFSGPKFDLGLSGALEGALENAVQDTLQEKLKEKLGEQAGGELDLGGLLEQQFGKKKKKDGDGR